jgi:hypothetical protein
MRRALVTALFTTGVLSSTGLAQEWKGHARVDGRVVGEGGAPVAGATVDARRISRPGGPRVTTDAEGRFTLDNIASGSWEVEVAAPGYRLRRLDVHLPRDSSWLGPVDVQLERQAPDAGEPDRGLVTSGDEAPPLRPTGLDGPLGYEDVRAALARGRVDQARRLTLAIEEHTPAGNALLFEIGVGFLNAGETREAVVFFDQVLEQDPCHVDARYRRALALLALGRHAEARGDLEAILEQRPDGALADKAKLALTQMAPGAAEEQ